MLSLSGTRTPATALAGDLPRSTNGSRSAAIGAPDNNNAATLGRARIALPVLTDWATRRRTRRARPSEAGREDRRTAAQRA
jgi:hypothetical protein